jgi:hypothetical protein
MIRMNMTSIMLEMLITSLPSLELDWKRMIVC